VPDQPRDAVAEAGDRLGGAYEVRVLEPSPGVLDPTARGDVPPGRVVVSPVGTGDVRWDALAAADPELAAWCAERWLAAYPRLGEPPAAYASTRDALHAVARHVLAPTRQRDRGEDGLRWVRAGLGTPFFGAGAQLRLEGDELVLQTPSRVVRGRLTTLQDAAEFVGFDLTWADLGGDSAPLDVDPAAAAFLGDLLGLGTSVLEELRARAGEDARSGPVELRPDSFRLEVALGDDDLGRRATFGLSTGDERRPDPYFFVRRWTLPSDAGGEDVLPWEDVADREDQREQVLRFLGGRWDALIAQ
jgi:hypothetical protein